MVSGSSPPFGPFHHIVGVRDVAAACSGLQRRCYRYGVGTDAGAGAGEDIGGGGSRIVVGGGSTVVDCLPCWWCCCCC